MVDMNSTALFKKKKKNIQVNDLKKDYYLSTIWQQYNTLSQSEYQFKDERKS